MDFEKQQLKDKETSTRQWMQLASNSPTHLYQLDAGRGGVRLLSRDDAQPWGSSNPRSEQYPWCYAPWLSCRHHLRTSRKFQEKIRLTNEHASAPQRRLASLTKS